MDFIKDITDFIFVNNKPSQADIIFIPGGSFPEPSERTAELYKEGFAPLVLPSGRYSITKGVFSGVSEKSDIYNGDYVDEWTFMADILTRNGVPMSAILQENRAQYTYQNALFSKEVTDRLDIQVNTAIICCKSTHARRCLMYYQLVYPDTVFHICPVDSKGITSQNWHKTSKGVKLVMGELKRIGEQFSELL